MRTVSEFFNTVDRKEFVSETGIKTQMITRAISDDVMPSGWFVLTRRFCVSRGIPVPEHLFRWTAKQSAS